MLTAWQRRMVSRKVQKILQDLEHKDLAVDDEIKFNLHIKGTHPSFYDDIPNESELKTEKLKYDHTS